ncbi:winged helix-turn-helix domain-containing protein [Deinococcus koreensis]|uniref:HTH arsR-type domain-containing protein n=1 Tax=Deinococcus koreensis TaxID=2054903 RepID=A0A2K3UXK1_9DEIO|nr:helix-turn-helix domain-containing protein [Deinococcus koreensis]PNY81270.1 hypothetical protein CVO96_07605 [Deinococcus koreensis]
MELQRVLSTPEELKKFADPTRMLLFRLLVGREGTLTQLGRALGLKPNLTLYHLRQLLELGLIEVVRHDDTGKHYRATALNVGISPTLRLRPEADPDSLTPPPSPAPPGGLPPLQERLHLADADRLALHAELAAVVARYAARQTPRADPCFVGVAVLSPLDGERGDP